MNVSLNVFDKEIKRKISVDSNVSLNKFCYDTILSMNGDLTHSYGIKIKGEFLDDEIIDEYDLNYLELEKNQRFKVYYDFGDGWIFNVRVSKIEEEYGNKRYYILSGKGYGIVEDSGGTFGLYDIFYNNDTSFGKYDINEFNIDKINDRIDKGV